MPQPVRAVLDTRVSVAALADAAGVLLVTNDSDPVDVRGLYGVVILTPTEPVLRI